jgi:hypothetical protein
MELADSLRKNEADRAQAFLEVMARSLGIKPSDMVAEWLKSGRSLK